jgi:glycine dehydrogenase
MLAIRQEVTDIEQGRLDRSDNPLRNAPHTSDDLAATEWSHPYSRERAVFPLPYLRDHKYWPPVNRVDNAFGDRNLMCICPPMESYS